MNGLIQIYTRFNLFLFFSKLILCLTLNIYRQQIDKNIPYPSPTTKQDLLKDYNFDKIDEIALNAITDNILKNSLENLVIHLTSYCVDELEVVRILYRWITSPKLSDIDCSQYHVQTVGRKIYSLQQKKNYSRLFYELCRYFVVFLTKNSTNLLLNNNFFLV